MGMYSYFQEEDIIIKDVVKLEAFLERWEKVCVDSVKCYEFNKEDKTFSLSEMDGFKLIQYWYEEDVIFFKLLGKYIDGHATFEYETGDEKATIRFENNSCKIDIGTIKYDEYEPKDLMSKTPDKFKDFVTIEEI